MKFEGRVAAGLDEFMLRYGHLKVLIGLLSSTSGNRERVSRRLAEDLTRPVSVPHDAMQDVGTYLMRKDLAQVLQASGDRKVPRSSARYAHLLVEVASPNTIERIVTTPKPGEVAIWFQDLAIADRRTASKVGAVTVNREQLASKSGVSHLVDWAVILGIANNRLGLTSLGRALAAAAQTLTQGSPVPNPYVIGPERLVLAWAMLQSDGDIFARMLPKLAREGTVVKSTAVDLMLDLAQGLQADLAGQKGGAGATALRVLRTVKEDLGLLSARRRPGAVSRSTVWHRVSSRLECLTDLGFLVKSAADGECRQFDYYYRATPALDDTVRLIASSDSPTEWAAAHLADLLASTLGITLMDVDAGPEMLTAALLISGPTGIQIEAFSVLAATIALSRGKRLSVAGARQGLESLAVRRPDIARLSRGYTGTGAEFASVVLSKLEAEGPSVFSGT